MPEPKRFQAAIIRAVRPAQFAAASRCQWVLHEPSRQCSILQAPWIDELGQFHGAISRGDGGNKTPLFNSTPPAVYQEQFLDYISKPGTRLMVIGYSFRDAHI